MVRLSGEDSEKVPSAPCHTVLQRYTDEESVLSQYVLEHIMGSNTIRRETMSTHIQTTGVQT